ncbi:FAS1 domain-containing protein [Trematosphaeria pertusa]|uniref:FAS1 domain-containing protein n=1 Tax=Trematosphaeria pertusa TaxID=390896 RepID=A0A6A6J357_9PLEO|nr:FAS1 domain-containing protein [Trematosphaeria pertusa]KAF2257008.1 FAS1 domain-containing protein [Trematosphaeria pertusa]
MRFSRVLPFLPLASAFVITDADVFETLEKSGKRIIDKTQDVLDETRDVFDETRDVLDEAFGNAIEGIKNVGENAYHKIHDAGCDVQSWLEGSSFEDPFVDLEDHPHHPPHGKPPHHKPPHKNPHHGRPHHPPHHGKPNLTVYEMISKSNYTTKLAKLIDEYPDLVETLNGTKANYTVFAPIDSAFEKIPKHGEKPSKEFIKNLLLYHVSEEFYPAGRVLHSYTIPTLLEPENLGHKQRLTVRVTLRGPSINFYSKIIAVNVFGTNGVIHGIDSILIPPPKVATIIDLLPGEFSTLELGLGKTGLFEKMNSSDYPHEGGTLFAPSNFAFKKLGPKINAFLFSKFGLKYLKALLEYHMVVNQTLYSDAFYDATSEDAEMTARPPHFHFDMPTVLDGKYLAVDVTRYGPFIAIRINGFARVTVHDGVASDGVIQVTSDVLIPPKNAGGEQSYWQGEEMSVEEFKERLEPFVEDDENMEL